MEVEKCKYKIEKIEGRGDGESKMNGWVGSVEFLTRV